MLYQIYKKKIAYFENNRKNKFEIFLKSQSYHGNDAKERTRIEKKGYNRNELVNETC
jgi:hypothetical protein